MKDQGHVDMKKNAESARAGRSRSWIDRLRAWCGSELVVPEQPGEPIPGSRRSWPGWACGLVSLLLLFHMTALLACEIAGQVSASPLEFDIGQKFYWYVVLINQEWAHAYFSPDPVDVAPVILAKLRFGNGQPDREIRIPDHATRPRIRLLREIAMAWHVTHEFTSAERRRLPSGRRRTPGTSAVRIRDVSGLSSR